MADNPNTDESIQESGGVPVLRMTVSPSQVVQSPVDKTLSISEMPADAKATGDAINNLGEALRDEITDLAADVIPKTSIDRSLLVDGAVAEAKTVGDALASIRESIASLTNMTFPVGSIYMTTETTVPETLGGTWVEILMPMTWNDLKRGGRNYTELGQNPPERNVHFFLRTE